jgi:hypothetical protein
MLDFDIAISRLRRRLAVPASLDAGQPLHTPHECARRSRRIDWDPSASVRWRATTDGEQLHVSMVHVPFGPGNAYGRTHSETSSNYLCTNDG